MGASFTSRLTGRGSYTRIDRERRCELNETQKAKEDVTSTPSRPIINHIGISGGKDSTALLLWAVHESGYDPDSINATFCDTGNEHRFTYAHVEMLSKKVCPIEWLKPKRDFYELAKWKHRFPGAKSRFCTQELKIFPTRDHVKALIESGNSVVLHSGVRASESLERSKMVVREELTEHTSEYRPLLRWSIEDVWAIHTRYGIPPNPLYAMGARRVGCFPCIMSRKAEIANIAKIAPEQIDRIRTAEDDWGNENMFHGFFCRDKVPMRFRSRKIRSADGRWIAVCTIDDVVRWATEKPDGVQQELALAELDTRAEDRTACQSTWGSCE
jgi:3'-phosphoadenosine 5'-phosphosulfate sulfotransferase (PAPS reductase)/FAD synthetase